jgi:hypothetical protein
MDREAEFKAEQDETSRLSFEKKSLVNSVMGYEFTADKRHQAFVKDTKSGKKIACVFFKQISEGTIIKVMTFTDPGYHAPELHKKLELSLENCLMGQQVENILWPIPNDFPTQIRSAEEAEYLKLYAYKEGSDHILLHIKQL